MATQFGLDLKRFWAMTDERLERIIKESVKDVIHDMQQKTLGVTAGGTLVMGMMPYVTTDLVTSLTIDVESKRHVGQFAYGPAMDGYHLGDEISFFWDQPYAPYIERGDDKFAGWHYIETNAANWPDIVLANARRIRNRRSSR